MYTDSDYLSYQDLNKIENRIEELNNKLQPYASSLPIYKKTEWKLNDFPYIQLIQKIESGIDNLGKYWYKPNDWQTTKNWLTGNETGQPIMSFSYIDINRWLNNLSAVEAVIGDKSVIWNGYTFINWNNNEENLDWE